MLTSLADTFQYVACMLQADRVCMYVCVLFHDFSTVLAFLAWPGKLGESSSERANPLWCCKFIGFCRENKIIPAGSQASTTGSRIFFTSP